MDLVVVPDGYTWLGLPDTSFPQLSRSYGEEAALHLKGMAPLSRVWVRGFAIDRFPVTRGEFIEWVHSFEWPVGPLRENNLRYWNDFEKNQRYDDRAPIVTATWEEAMMYCWWKGGRLPFETEWIRAARGESKAEVPWNGRGVSKRANWKPKKVRLEESWRYLEDVRSNPLGASWCGVMDMLGNCSELTLTPFIWSATSERKSATGFASLRKSVGAEQHSFGRDYVLMDVDYLSKYLCIGLRGAVEPFRILANSNEILSCRWPLVGFRCAYEDPAAAQRSLHKQITNK